MTKIDTRYVQFFDSGIAPEHDLLGGKCSSLVTMTAAGMPVPPGFTVTTAAYEKLMGDAGVTARIGELMAKVDYEDLENVEATGAEIREAIINAAVVPVVRESVLAAWEELQGRFTRPVPVAVRSSATAEDLPGASFAGQQDTYLWITTAEDMIEHIRRCNASLYTSRAMLYRWKNDIPEEGLSMAVGVQKMVSARTAGVAMTMNPNTGDRSKIVIDASWGIGEAVVSGEVTPDNIMLDKVMMTVVSETVSDKHIELIPDPDNPGQLVRSPVEEERRKVRSLTDEEVRAVAEMAKRAEQHYGTPQDIEWAVDSDLPDGENLLLLQARPETVHSNKKPASTASFTTGVSSLTSALTRNGA